MFLSSYLIRTRINYHSLLSCADKNTSEFLSIRCASAVARYSSNRNDDVGNRETFDRVHVEIDKSTGICRVQLNRPTKLNAFDLAMFEAVAKTASDLKGDRSIRAIILSGRGRAFSTGLDVKAILKDQPPIQTVQQLLERHSRQFIVLPEGDNSVDKDNTINSNLAQDVAVLWRELNVPVIAVVQGMCYGAGLQVALGADFRYTTPDCQFSIMEGKWGLIPDMGASILLRELVRIDVAKELTMTGRIISGREAADLGLITRVCDDPVKEADLFAEKLVKSSPDAIAAAKHLFQATWVEGSNNKSLLLESTLQQKLLASWNQLAASGRAVVGWDFPYRKRK